MGAVLELPPYNYIRELPPDNCIRELHTGVVRELKIMYSNYLRRLQDFTGVRDFLGG